MNPRNTATDLLNVKVARKVLQETLGLKPGESITIETWSNSIPLALAFSLEAKRMGAIPLTIFEDEDSYVEGIRVMPKETLGAMGKHEYGLLEATDVYVFIPGPPLAPYSRKITRQEFADSTRYNDSWYEAAAKAKLRGARLTSGYIGEDMAKVLGKDMGEVIGHQLNAALVDFDSVGRSAKAIAGKFRDGTSVSIRGRGTDLTLELKGDLDVQDGKTDASDMASGENVSYVPPGFVFKEIDGGSAKGKALLAPTLTRFGLLKDADLVVRDGQIVEWSSKGSPEVLRALAEAIPERSRVLRAVTVGLNPMMKYGFGQDRFPAGAVGLVSTFTGILRGATMKAGSELVVRAGTL